jgi:hypothetical protein
MDISGILDQISPLPCSRIEKLELDYCTILQK